MDPSPCKDLESVSRCSEHQARHGDETTHLNEGEQASNEVQACTEVTEKQRSGTAETGTMHAEI